MFIVIFGGWNVKGKISHKCQITEPDKLEKENGNMYRIIGIIGGQYIVKTDKGLKRVKIKASDNKRIGDQIKIEKL